MTRKRWLMLGCGGGLLLLVLGVALVALGGYWLWRTAPTYWQHNQNLLHHLTKEQRLRLADDAFNTALAQLSTPSKVQGSKFKVQSSESQVAFSRGALSGGPSGGRSAPAGTIPQSPNHQTAKSPDPQDPGLKTQDSGRSELRQVKLSFKQINVWLAERLPDWLANQNQQMPPGVSEPMVAPDGQRLIAAFHYKRRNFDQIISVVLRLELRRDGKAILHVDDVRGGRLSMPANAILNEIKKRRPDLSGDEAGRVAAAMDGQPFDPVAPMPGDSGHRLRLVAYTITPREVMLTFRVGER